MIYKNKILTSVNKVYREKNPSSHIKITKKILKIYIKSKKNF